MRAIREGISGTEALSQYREGGGHIATSYWFDVYRELKNADTGADLITTLPDDYYLPRESAAIEDINYASKYVLQVEVAATDIDGNVYPSLHRYVESDSEMTWGDWQGAVKEALMNDPSIPDITEVEIRDFTYVIRAS
jgi:hypothetical protein